MADKEKTVFTLNEREALEDMRLSQKYLTEKYSALLSNGGSNRVRTSVSGWITEIARGQDLLNTEIARRGESVYYARSEEEKRLALRLKKFKKEMENNAKLSE